MAGKADLGGIFNETFALISDNLQAAAIFTLVVGGFSALGVLFGFYEPAPASFSLGFVVTEQSTLASGLFDLAATAIAIVAGYLLMKTYLGSRNRLRTGANRFWPYLGLTILAVLGIMLGMIVLIVPGVILLVRWTAATGFVMGAERSVPASFRLSWEATKGHGWSIFFAGLILVIGIILAIAMIGGILALASSTVSMVVSAFLEAASTAVTYAFTIAIYVLVSNEGEDLQEVFA